MARYAETSSRFRIPVSRRASTLARLARRVSGRLLLPVCLALAAACAARPPAAAVPAPAPVDVDALVRRGCYRCLEAAFDAAVAAGRTEQAFEAAALLASRSRELGLPAERWLTHMETLLPPGPDWEVYRDIVDTQQADPTSGDRDVLMDAAIARRRTPDVYDTWREVIRTGSGSPLFRAYLDLVVACRQDFVGRDVVDDREGAIAAVLLQFGTDVPLLRYRVGLCGGRASPHLDAARQAEPGLVDAELELGRRELQRRPSPDLDGALRRFQLAGDAFPESPVIPVLMGEVFERREQWPDALAAYEAALALVPTHRDALLGKTMSLSHLDQYENAAAAATRLLELGNWFVGPAHYWRGWNLYHLERMAEARADTDRALALMKNASVVVLSGTIDWRLGRLESAEQELQEALAMDFGQCEAALYLGGVRLELRRWPESLSAYEHAQQCFDLSIATRRKAIAESSATPAGAAANAWQIAAHQRAIADAEVLRSEAEQNAAAVQKFLQKAR